MTGNSHTKALTDATLEACLRFDWNAAGLEPPARLPNYFARLANRWLKKRGYVVQDRAHALRVQENLLYFISMRPVMMATHALLLREPEAFDKTFEALADEESRRTFDWYVQHRFATAYLYDFATTLFPAPVSRQEFERVKDEQRAQARATGLPLANLTSLALGQYSLTEYGACVNQGDVVVDAGGASGDTAWLFQKQTGESGKVHVFEPLAAQRAGLEARCRESGWSNVHVAPYGLWDKNGSAEICIAGEASAIQGLGAGKQGRTETIETLTLDQFVRDNGMERVDFIKMDIEGAEQNALLGCRETIKRCAPKLAISAYHLADDMLRIPEIIRETGVPYRLHLRHYTHFFGDTVLYAVPA